MKEFTVKEDQAFRLKVKTWKCLAPADLNAVEFINETLKDGDVDMSSTYQFFMTDADIKKLCEGMLA